MTREAAERLLARAWGELGQDASALRALQPLPEVPLAARLDVSALAAASVAAASLAPWAGDPAPPGSIALDGDRIATAFQSERVARFDGVAPAVWSPLSGFRRARNGWVRTHGNYPHHAAALRSVLGVGDDADSGEVDRAVAGWDAVGLADAVTRAGGMCVAVRTEDPRADAELRRQPLIDVTQLGESSPAPMTAAAGLPLAGIRVLDLTRVIAGPVATRTLALLGAEVLRIDPPEPAELWWQHLEGAPGKRSAILDLGSPDGAAAFERLLAGADAVVLGYRPASLARRGLDPVALAERHPGLVIAELSAWGSAGRAGERGGFDSLVQAASGIASVEGDLDAPGALPAQALDHATGYFLAAAVTVLLRRRASRGGSWLARMSLRRTATELLAMPRHPEPEPHGIDPARRDALAVTLVGPAGTQRIAPPAIATPSGPTEWRSAPRPWGSDPPEWA